MILVECAVVEITDGNDLDSGFRWSYKSPEHSFGADAGTGVVGGRELSLANALATAISPTPKLQAWLQALTTRGRAEVRAHPSMAAVNGKTAEIFIGSQRFIKMTYVKNGQNQDKLETVPVGVRLQVRPWTGGNSEITTWIDVEVSNIVAMDPQTGIPRLSTRNASTTMRTVDGDTIVIGGLTLMQDEKTTRRIPLLGDLPLIGSLFRSSATRTSAAEMAILIRPRLLDAGGHLPSEEELRIRGEFALPPETRKP
jgi:type II secretory pathway component GspD/PulD (secretin)